MMRSRAKQMKMTLFGAVVIATATMAASQSALGQVPWTGNTAKQNILNGLPIVAKRIAIADSTEYCNVATTPGTHFTWVDTAGSGLDYPQAWALWATSCPGAVATMRGAEVKFGERVEPATGAIPVVASQRTLTAQEVQKATDGGAMVLMVPMDNSFQATEVVKRAYYPPVGSRIFGPSQAVTLYAGETADYRATFNDNLVVIAIVGTVDGVYRVSGTVGTSGIHAIYLDAKNLESSSGYAEGSADFNKLADLIKAAAKAKNKHLCTADRSTSPHTLTCVRQP